MAKKKNPLVSDPTEGLEGVNKVAEATEVVAEPILEENETIINHVVTEECLENNPDLVEEGVKVGDEIEVVESTEEENTESLTTENVETEVSNETRNELVEVHGLELETVSGKEHYKTEEGVYLPIGRVVVKDEKTFIPKWLHELKFGK